MAGFFDIGGDVIKEAEAASSFKLIVPPTAKTRKDGASWSEEGGIIAASSETVQADLEGRKVEVLVLKLKISISKEGSGSNEGKMFDTNFRINRYALQNGKGASKGTPMYGQRFMSNMSITRVKQVLRACGIQPDTEDGGYSQAILSECFPDISNFTSEPSPLIGQRFWFEVQERTSESKTNGKTYTNYDLANILETS